MALGDTLSGENRNAFEALNDLFTSYGLSTLAPKIFDFIQKGYSADTIGILLQDTSEYKARFAGNEQRKAAGLPVLSPADYLNTESNYRQIMRNAGLPIGFYDQPSDFVNFLGKDVSPTELKSRVDIASQATLTSNPEYRQALNQMGISDASITAHFLDPDAALPLLQKEAATAQIGAESMKRGFMFDQAYAGNLANQGITAQQAAQGYGQIASTYDPLKGIAQSYGENLSFLEAEQGVFEPGVASPGGEAGSAKAERLASWNRARNVGNSGAAAGGLAQSTGGRV